MAIVARSLIIPSYLLCPRHSIHPSKPWEHNDGRFGGCNLQTLPRNKVLGERWLFTRHFSRKHIVTAKGYNYNSMNYEEDLNYEEDVPSKPFWAWLVQDYEEAMDSLFALFAFLAEQPSQLKYIEWPSFQSTLKTACLTLIIVALFIVALWSIDSVLCYLLILATKRNH